MSSPKFGQNYWHNVDRIWESGKLDMICESRVIEEGLQKTINLFQSPLPSTFVIIILSSF